MRKQDQQERDELETLLEVYLQAIKGAPLRCGQGWAGKGSSKGCLTAAAGRRLSISEAGVPLDRHS